MKNKPEKTMNDLKIPAVDEFFEIGETYPIYGMITDIFIDDLNVINILVDDKIHLELRSTDDGLYDKLQMQCFETGTFLSEIVSTIPDVFGICSAIVFDNLDPQTVH